MRRLTLALLLSLLIHMLLLSLTFGGEGFGLPGFGFPWQVRRIDAADLRLVLVPAQVAAAERAGTSVKEPMQASIVQPVAREPTLTPSVPRAPTLGRKAEAIMPKAKRTARAEPTAEAKPEPDIATGGFPANARLRTDGAGDAAPTPIPEPGVIPMERSDEAALVVPAAPTPVIAAAPSTSSPETAVLAPRDAGDAAQEPIDLAARQRADELANLERSERESQRQAAQLEAARIESARQEAARQESERVESVRLDAERQEAALPDARLEAERREAARQAAVRQEAALREAGRLEAERQEATRVEAARVEAAKVEAAKANAARVEAARVEAARVEAARVEAAPVEAAPVEAAPVEAAKVEAARVEAARVEAARVEAAQVEAARVEAARAEAARVRLRGSRPRGPKPHGSRLRGPKPHGSRLRGSRLHGSRLRGRGEVEAARVEAARAEAARAEAARAEAARVQAARVEAARAEAARVEAAKVEAAKVETARVEGAQEAAARREAALRAIGRQLDEEADRREAASSARRYWLFGRTDPNAELILYVEAWSRKIQLNATTFDMVREAAKQPHTDPLVTVAIRSDGSVESVTFVRSSGVVAIDEAIRRIVDSQKPYQVFPPGLAREFDVIMIRRSWYFDTAIRLQ